MDDKTAIGISAIICITMIEITAIVNGIDGVILTTVIGSISAIATGLFTRNYYMRKKGDKK